MNGTSSSTCTLSSTRVPVNDGVAIWSSFQSDRKPLFAGLRVRQQRVFDLLAMQFAQILLQLAIVGIEGLLAFAVEQVGHRVDDARSVLDVGRPVP